MDPNKKRLMADAQKKKLEKVEESPASINNLNNDCLVLIFQNLPTIADKIRVESVCKRWRDLRKYTWQNFYRLDLKSDTWGVKRSSDPIYVPIKVFFEVGEICGPNLTTIELSVDLFGQIVAWTKNIREVTLFNCLYHSVVPLSEECECYDVWPDVVEYLLPQCKNITKFHMNFRLTRYLGTDLGRLFTNMKKLKSLHLHTLSDLMLDEAVPRGELWVKKLHFEETDNIFLEGLPAQFDKEIFFSIFRRCNSLQRLVLCKLEVRRLECILDALEFRVGHLKNLQFRTSADDKNFKFSSRLIRNISRWTNLETLCVIAFNEFITDTFLQHVAATCKKLVNLSVCSEEDCDSISDLGVSLIAELPRLRRLNLAGLPIKHPPLARMQNLEVLNISCCSFLEDRPLCEFLEREENLQLISIIGCGSLSYNVLDLVLRILRIRNSRKIFTMFVEQERVDNLSCDYSNLIKFETDFINSIARVNIDDLRDHTNKVDMIFTR